MRLTIKDIAAEAHVSVSTVSKCLNGYADVSEETRKHVIATIERMDYVPNTFARYVATKKTGVVGLTIPDIKDPYFAQSTYGIEQELKGMGYSLFLGNLDRKDQNFLEFIRRAREMRFDGLIITPDCWSPEAVAALKNLEIPVLSIRRRPPESCPVTYIDVDHYESGLEMMGYLYGLGHRRIAHVVLPNEAGEFRAQAYRDFCQKHEMEDLSFNAEIPASLLPDAMANGEKATEAILSRNLDVTAIFAGSDFIAMGVLSCLKKIGKRVPEDISVAGIGNNEYSGFSWFDLTTMELHRDAMGRRAAEMLNKMMAGEHVDSVLCSASLIQRGSTRPL